MFGDKKYRHLEALVIAQTALLASLIEEMDDKGLINKKKVMDRYEVNLKQGMSEEGLTI